MMEYEEVRKRIVIEGVEPEIDEDRFPVKCVVGNRVVAEGDVIYSSWSYYLTGS